MAICPPVEIRHTQDNHSFRLSWVESDDKEIIAEDILVLSPFDETKGTLITKSQYLDNASVFKDIDLTKAVDLLEQQFKHPCGDIANEDAEEAGLALYRFLCQKRPKAKMLWEEHLKKWFAK